MTTRVGRRIIIAASLTGLVVVLGAVAILTLRSAWLRDRVRSRIVTEVERATGGRVEMGGFQFNWSKLEATLAPFILHGKERPGDPVFVHAVRVQVALRVVSAWKRDVDIDSLIVDRPEVHVIVYPDGSTNLPDVAGKRRLGSLPEDLLKLAVRHFEFRNGSAEVRAQRAPFDFRGDELRIEVAYEPGPLYRGHVSSRRLRMETERIRPVLFDLDTHLALDKDQLSISKLSIGRGQSRFTATGTVHNFDHPRAELTFASDVAMADVGDVVALPIEPQGDAAVRGRAVLSWNPAFEYSAEGQVSTRGLAYQDRRIRATGIMARGDFQFSRNAIWLSSVTATALGGAFEGRAELTDNFEHLRLEGNARNLSLAGLSHVAAGQPRLAWSGTASGRIRIDGRVHAGRARDFTVQARMDIAPAPGAIPVRGNVDMTYDQRANSVRLANSTLSTAASRIVFSGTLGETLRASVETTNLNDLIPGLLMLDPDAPKQLPLTLVGGTASADVIVTGRPPDARVAGRVVLGRFERQGRTFDGLTAEVALSRGDLVASNITLDRGALRVSGSLRIGLSDWKPVDASSIGGTLSVHGTDVQALLAEAGEKLPVSGQFSASFDVRGTYGSPQAAVKLTVVHPAAYGETFDELRADAQVSETALQVRTGELRGGRGEARFSGSYQRTGSDWRTGSIQFDVSGRGFRLEQFQHIRDFKSGLSGLLTMKATGAARLRQGDMDIDSLEAEVNATGMTRGKATVGNMLATARTSGRKLSVQAAGVIRGSEIRGSGEWALEGDYPGRGDVQFTPIAFESLDEMIAQGPVELELPFVGTLDGRATISGPLKKPGAMRAEITLGRVQLSSNPKRPLRAGARGQDLVLRNTEPVRMTASLESLEIRSARFAATDTGLEASGRITFDAKSPWNVVVRGRMNLAILQLFNSDIAARGNAVLNTNIRGALANPEVNGRLELHNASLYLADLPAGVGADNANGVVTFDRNRANIESLTAEVGGGRVGFSGFIGFGGDILLYHVQGTAQKVRLRHPDGVSATANAALNLSGTSRNGLVSGVITVTRAALESSADLGSLLAQMSQPLPAPAEPGEYLRGLNFDVRIESGPNLEVQTSLTHNLQAEAELRARGNLARPTLTGDISVNQGEIQFLGNKYTINRGDIRFVNPVRIEPVFDVDLQTKARGITVNISFSGALNKLNVAYRSDPPLQSADIIALLAVGRDPALAAVANAQSRTNLLETGASTLSQAVAAPVSNRLQRFFGVSRVKIDPSLTGVDNIPQARLTLEQQVSRDITLTYITNLQRTQEQLVQVQWDINRQWSAIAVREENGVFGIDFQYRKRFK